MNLIEGPHLVPMGLQIWTRRTSSISKAFFLDLSITIFWRTISTIEFFWSGRSESLANRKTLYFKPTCVLSVHNMPVTLHNFIAARTERLCLQRQMAGRINKDPFGSATCVYRANHTCDRCQFVTSDVPV